MQVPFAFGFPLYRSILDAKTTGLIPAPAPGEQSVANHAVVAMGYDDELVIANGAGKTTGALLVKNSWSDGWGQQGFGWLPYQFVLQGLTRDFWTLTRAEWTDSGVFQLIE
jgi:C1A family cysteine protease